MCLTWCAITSPVRPPGCVQVAILSFGVVTGNRLSIQPEQLDGGPLLQCHSQHTCLTAPVLQLVTDGQATHAASNAAVNRHPSLFCTGMAGGSAAKGPQLVVYWPEPTVLPQKQQIQRQLLQDLIQEQAPGSFLRLAPSNSSDLSTVQEEAHHGTICLMESHSSEPVNGSQSVQLGCVGSLIVAGLAVSSIAGHVWSCSDLLTETSGQSLCTSGLLSHPTPLTTSLHPGC